MHLRSVAGPVHLFAGGLLPGQAERGKIWRSRPLAVSGRPVVASLLREEIESVTGLSCFLSSSCSSATPWLMPSDMLPAKLHRVSFVLLAYSLKEPGFVKQRAQAPLHLQAGMRGIGK